MTTLEKAVLPAVRAKPGLSGFVALPDGTDALASRLLLADSAVRSVDAQYYQLANDTAGKLFLESLLRAADRGVRVRLLIDDYLSRGKDLGLAVADLQPNLEVRIYNPFLGGNSWGIFSSLARMNRRMHNKSFTVDEQICVIGGRNVADHYYGVGANAYFGDLDLVGVGPVVKDVASMFRTYWDSEHSKPLQHTLPNAMPRLPSLAELMKSLVDSRTRARTSRYRDALEGSMSNLMGKDLSRILWAKHELAFDHPDKTKGAHSGSGSVRELLTNKIKRARSELLIVSPYFVPRAVDIEGLARLSDRGVDVSIVTNSLSSNNQPAAHANYAPCRVPLLRAGIKIFELRPDAGEEDKATRTTLHAKLAAIDGRDFFAGSFNFDPRSANLNTELGIAIESEALAGALVEAVRGVLRSGTFEVFLSDQDTLRWRTEKDGDVLTFSEEPMASLWNRLGSKIAQTLPLRDHV